MGNVLSHTRPAESYAEVEDLEMGIDETEDEIAAQIEPNQLETAVEQQLKATIAIIPPTNESLARFEQLLEKLVGEMKISDTLNTIPEPKSYLYYARLHPVFVQMLEDIVQYREYLERFIIRLQAENETTVPKPNPKSKPPARKPSAPIHYTVLQLNEEFLDFLLARPNIDVNLRDHYKRTALTLLCEKYDQCMRKSVSDLPSYIQDPLATIRTLIKKLLQAGADFNICSMLVKLPFELLLKHSKYDESFFVQCANLARGPLAISSLNERNERVVKFYNKNSPVKVTVELLEIFLRYNEPTKFLDYMAKFDVNETNVKQVIRLLLHTACDQKLPDCVKLILNNGASHIFRLIKPKPSLTSSRRNQPEEKPTATAASSDDPHWQYGWVEEAIIQAPSELEHRLELKGLLKKVCLMADLPLLERFLAKISEPILLNDDPLLVVTLRKAYECKSTKERNALLACVEHLLKQKNIDIYKADNSGNTSLHLALKYGFDSIVQLLLAQRYSYLGITNKANQTPLDFGTRDFWWNYFNKCIEVNWKLPLPDRCDIRFNLNGFCSPLQEEVVGDPTVNTVGSDSSSYCKKIQKPASTVTEMTTLLHIAKSKELRGLLKHPVLYAFIMVKWARACPWNVLNLLLTVLTIIFFGIHSLTACTAGSSSTGWLGILSFMFMMIRELLQSLLLRQSYLTLANALNIITATMMAVMLWMGCHRLTTSFILLNLAMQIVFLVELVHPTKSTKTVYMFVTFLLNLLKSFVKFSPLLFAFSMAFYIMYNKTPAEAQKDFNNFDTFWNVIMKTLVMVTGEFEAAAIDLEDGRKFLFILFICIASIGWYNFASARAFSDNALESELISISKKVMMLEQYERGVANVGWLRRCFPKPFFSEYQNRIHVKTKQYNKVVVQAKRNPHTKSVVGLGDREMPVAKFPCLLNCDSSNFFSSISFLREALFTYLPQPVVDDALAIIEKQQAKKMQQKDAEHAT